MDGDDDEFWLSGMRGGNEAIRKIFEQVLRQKAGLRYCSELQIELRIRRLSMGSDMGLFLTSDVLCAALTTSYSTHLQLVSDPGSLTFVVAPLAYISARGAC